MCTVSAVMGDGFKTWPGILDGLPTYPTTPALTQQEIARIKAFLDLIEKAKIFDKVTGQPDCAQPEKDQLIQALTDRVAKLESTLGAMRDLFFEMNVGDKSVSGGTTEVIRK